MNLLPPVRGFVIRWAAVLLAGLLPVAVAAAPDGLPRLGQVEIRGAPERDAARWLDSLDLRPGQVIWPGELDYAAKLLGLRVEVETVGFRIHARDGQRWDVIFEVGVRPLVADLRLLIEGRMPVGEPRLRSTLDQVRRPFPLHAPTMAELVSDATALLFEEGYRAPSLVTALTELGSDRYRLDLRVTPGPLWRVRDAIWTGVEAGMPATPDLRGAPLNEAVLGQRVDRWLRDLRAKGYRDAQARLECGTLAPGDARCNIEVAAGPLFSLRFAGNRTYFDPDLLQALDLDPVRRHATGELLRRARALEEFYLGQGFHFARVTASTEGGEGALSVIYWIEEGRSRGFRRIELIGVPPEQQSTVLQAMAISPKTMQQLIYGKSRGLSAEARAEDLERVVYALQREGYLEARVLADRIVAEPDDVAVRWEIEVDAGPAYRWSALQIPDSQAWGLSVPRPSGLRKDEVANVFAFRDLASEWVSRLRDAGYLDAQVDAQYGVVAPGQVEGDLKVDPGTRYRVAAVVVRGNRRARNSAILNSLPLRQGDLADHSRLFEGRRRLLERRVFHQVQSEWVLRDPAIGRAVALYEVQERAGGEIEAGLLLTTDEGIGFDLRGAHYRLFGTFRTLRLEGSATFLPGELRRGDWPPQPFRSRWSLRYREPFPNRIPLAGQLQALSELNRNDPDYDWEARNLSVGMVWEPSLHNELNFDYLYEWFTRFNVLYPLYDPAGTDRIGSLRLTGFVSRFDDRFDPTRGWGSFHELQWARPWLGGSFGFIRYEGSLRGLMPLIGRLSLWLGGRAGTILGVDEMEGIPRFKRFRLGGANSVRGYERESVSPWVRLPNGEGLALGGRDFVNLQSELRIGVWNAIDLALFVDNAVVRGFDGGAVLGSGYGAGLLYHTPAGPLRLDVGRKFVDLPTDPSTYTIHFYIFASL